MRVQLRALINHDTSLGIIPACAGTTEYITYARMPLWDHPRVCGYNSDCESSVCYCLGSSPRVRVQQDDKEWRYDYRRDHPRVCGYNSKKPHKFSDSILYRFCFSINLILFLIIYHPDYFFILSTNFLIFKANSSSNFASSNAL